MFCVLRHGDLTCGWPSGTDTLCFSANNLCESKRPFWVSMAAAADLGQSQREVLDDYWREFQDIELNKDGDGEDEDLPKTPDGRQLSFVNSTAVT